jgi:hypothetical protein
VSRKHPITLSEDDFSRLHVLRGHAQLAALETAVVLEPHRIPPDVVTMNSRVRFEDKSTGEIRDVPIVFPSDANVSGAKSFGVGDGRYSVVESCGRPLDPLAIPGRCYPVCYCTATRDSLAIATATPFLSLRLSRNQHR